jgi:hypothetical protein
MFRSASNIVQQFHHSVNQYIIIKKNINNNKWPLYFSITFGILMLPLALVLLPLLILTIYNVLVLNSDSNNDEGGLERTNEDNDDKGEAKVSIEKRKVANNNGKNASDEDDYHRDNSCGILTVSYRSTYQLFSAVLAILIIVYIFFLPLLFFFFSRNNDEKLLTSSSSYPLSSIITSSFLSILIVPVIMRRNYHVLKYSRDINYCAKTLLPAIALTLLFVFSIGFDWSFGIITSAVIVPIISIVSLIL